MRCIRQIAPEGQWLIEVTFTRRKLDFLSADCPSWSKRSTLHSLDKSER